MMLSKKQKTVARALYEGELGEEEIVRQFGVSGKRVRDWLGEEEFGAELMRLCGESQRETRFILARYGPIAALRLAELLGSDKPDIARRAALDMIDRCLTGNEPAGAEGDDAAEAEWTDEQVREMLGALTGGFNTNGHEL